MSAPQYDALPGQLCVREVKVHGRVLVPTMLKQRQVGKGELDEL